MADPDRTRAACAALGGAIIPIEDLARLHRATPLALGFIDGRPGHAHLNGDRAGLVTELIRLARFGALMRLAAADQPTLTAAALVVAVETELQRANL